MRPIRFSVFGHRVLVAREGARWQAYYAGPEGKRRPATDIVIPHDIPETDLARYLDDLCHEWATSRNPCVKRIE